MTVLNFRIPRIKLDQETTRRERVFFAVAVVGILIFFHSALWSPRTEALKARRAELKSIQVQTDAMRKLVETTRAQIGRLGGELKKEGRVDERVEKMMELRAVDPAEEINTTADLLSHRTIARRVQVRGVTVGARADKANYTVVPMTVEFTGPFTGVEGYLRTIENLDRPLAVKSFEMRADKGAPGVLNTTMEVELYIPKP